MFHFDKSRLVRDEQLINISAILTAFDTFHPDTSRSTNLEHPLNKYLNSVTFEVSQLDTFNVVSLEQL